MWPKSDVEALVLLARADGPSIRVLKMLTGTSNGAKKLILHDRDIVTLA